MNADEKIRASLVCYIGAFIEGNISVVLPGVDHLYTGYILFNIMSDFQSDFQGHILLKDLFATCTGVLSSVPRVDNDHIYLEFRGADISAGGV